MIPDKSEASIKNGNWYIHHDGTNLIQIWGSNLNGKEKVFLNNELVSEQIGLKMQSSHNFTDKAGQQYQVTFNTESLRKGNIQCSIIKEGETLKTFKTKYIKGKNLTINRLLILILASAIFGVMASIFKLSDFIFYIFLAIVLVFHFMTRDYGKIIIEEQ